MIFSYQHLKKVHSFANKILAENWLEGNLPLNLDMAFVYYILAPILQQNSKTKQKPLAISCHPILFNPGHVEETDLITCLTKWSSLLCHAQIFLQKFIFSAKGARYLKPAKKARKATNREVAPITSPLWKSLKVRPFIVRIIYKRLW